MQMVVAPHKLLFALTCGRFSLIHEGTVVTNPKLNKMVPITPAWEPVKGSKFTAGSPPCSGPKDERLKTTHNNQHNMVNANAIVWIIMLSSKCHRPHGNTSAAVTTRPQVKTTWQPHALPCSKCMVFQQETHWVDAGTTDLSPSLLVRRFANGVMFKPQVPPNISEMVLSIICADWTIDMTFRDCRAPFRPIWDVQYQRRPKKWSTIVVYSAWPRKFSLPGMFRMASQYIDELIVVITQTLNIQMDGSNQPASTNMFGNSGIPGPVMLLTSNAIPAT
mmetsp:Transcript_95681/g.292597  ORF Transcript_95681/g.292597 Transcript_95681/m.292597 type:complete len:277 (-) Transcript_95681:155-985(-)